MWTAVAEHSNRRTGQSRWAAVVIEDEVAHIAGQPGEGQNSVVLSTRQLSSWLWGQVEKIAVEPQLLMLRIIESQSIYRRALFNNHAKAEIPLKPRGARKLHGFPRAPRSNLRGHTVVVELVVYQQSKLLVVYPLSGAT